jgi:hypothetical protein
VYRSALTLSLCLALLPSEARSQRGVQRDVSGWPFAGSGFDGLDLFNLGLLGAKASDASKPPPAGRTQTGRRSVSANPNDNKAADVGPERLRIHLLFPGGPAEKAGLKVGDVITGVEGGAAFDKGSSKPLADALRKAEGNKEKPVVTLVVEGADGKPKKVAVKIAPAAQKDRADPTKPAGRAAIGDAACAWLAERQNSEGGYAETLGGRMGAVVQTSVAGLAWLAHGSTATKGKYAANVAKARDFVAKYVGQQDRGLGAAPGGANWNQENWGWCHAAIFLGELQLREPSAELKAHVLRCGAALVKNQEASGGWAHGPGGPNGLGYVELNIMAALALSGLGLAKQCGAEIPKDALMRAVDYVEASSSGGGVGYSTKPGQQGQGNIGRSAGCWLGYRALGFEQRPFTQSMQSYVARTIGDVLGGHASLMQQTLLAGVAAAALGGEAQKKFWLELSDDATLARAPDGSLQPRPWHETVAMESNSDVSAGEVWTTACWAIVCLGDGAEKPRTGLPAWAGMKKKS